MVATRFCCATGIRLVRGPDHLKRRTPDFDSVKLRTGGKRWQWQGNTAATITIIIIIINIIDNFLRLFFYIIFNTI